MHLASGPSLFTTRQASAHKFNVMQLGYSLSFYAQLEPAHPNLEHASSL